MTADELKAWAKKGVEADIGMATHMIEGRFKFDDMGPIESVRHLVGELDKANAAMKELDELTVMVVDKQIDPKAVAG